MNTRIEPIELTDDELKAVAGGQFSVSLTNSTSTNSFNASGNTSNSFNNNNNSFNG